MNRKARLAGSVENDPNCDIGLEFCCNAIQAFCEQPSNASLDLGQCGQRALVGKCHIWPISKTSPTKGE
jgi:hypothetical protein